MQASSTTTTTTTKTKKLSSSTGSGAPNMISSVAVTSATKTTTTTRKPAGASPKSPKASTTGSAAATSTSASDPEIAEISKKINEHADAIYRKWKMRGLPPVELLEMYTNAAGSGDFAEVAGAPTADAEGLQKMVTSFVNKDKEQRGKTAKKSEGPAANGKVKKSAAAGPATAGGASAFEQALQSPKKVAAVSKSLPDVNLNYDINLHLDMNNLSQEQTAHLLKISEIIQQQKEATAANPLKKRQSGGSSSSGSGSSGKVANSVKVTAAAAAPEQQSPTKKQTKAKSGTSAVTAAVSIDVIDAPQPHRVAEAVSDKSAEATVVATNRKSSKTKENSAEGKQQQQQQQQQQQPATKEKPATSVVATATRKSTRGSSATDNSHSSSNIVSNASSVGTSAPATAATSMDATSVSTTMPTLNKVKPTSGARPALTNGSQDPTKNKNAGLLTRGSVAERVLMFEKCPDVRHAFLNIKRPQADVAPKSLLKVKLHATPPPPPDTNLLQKEIRSTKSVYIPRFYFPHGKPQPTIAMERVVRGILSGFDSFPNNQVTKDDLPRILKLCGMPYYWRMPVMVFCQTSNSGLVERQRFVEFWKQMNIYCHEAASRFVYILSRGQRFRSYIVPEDLVPMVQDVVDTHPGLAFLKEATEFHSRYVHTVIARIFYSVNRSWSGRITIAELKRSDLLEMISLLEEEEDINQIMAFFSYEHFYVIYCKFWELDKDHDLLINQEDLAKHSDHALSSRIVERIFSGCVTRTDSKKGPEEEAKMSYTDFVWFILSEEDKRTPTAIEYWFRCMDIDGDGALSMYELEYFYEEQQQRMEGIGIECLPFEDCLCQMLDMIKPANRDCITLGDLKRCKMTHVFFDTFFNLEKYLDHEQRDPFASQRDEYTSDWDRFAAQEYELLISEEND
ncbi:serine/threonine protein phosphatase 2A regulatory subunit B''alpha [Drosophila miranda]|uniref:serine/threonine protein phosphatase 2A regulatory subunit B''alpha n=1 Tax=Drosophila miranda TaxID=7229 RepID=UPI0007E6D1F5|nr:serine/threonine protein phosphatase 2A regulatory subunit B''alpha [Drosophila miranda]XP_017142521.1 serine/threonine protein phosphatase 2A regulatory subunit B''alpha [Drosophila miranda]XP_033244219.1 serine/threonine protein phosphatase 2A regulatory subunit B''alpha [Drosophila miranda]